MIAAPLLVWKWISMLLRLLYRVVNEAHANWPGGCPEEQICLSTMKTQLYAALMENLFEQ